MQLIGIHLIKMSCFVLWHISRGYLSTEHRQQTWFILIRSTVFTPRERFIRMCFLLVCFFVILWFDLLFSVSLMGNQLFRALQNRISLMILPWWWLLKYIIIYFKTFPSISINHENQKRFVFVLTKQKQQQ